MGTRRLTHHFDWAPHVSEASDRSPFFPTNPFTHHISLLSPHHMGAALEGVNSPLAAAATAALVQRDPRIIEEGNERV